MFTRLTALVVAVLALTLSPTFAGSQNATERPEKPVTSLALDYLVLHVREFPDVPFHNMDSRLAPELAVLESRGLITTKPSPVANTTQVVVTAKFWNRYVAGRYTDAFFAHAEGVMFGQENPEATPEEIYAANPYPPLPYRD